MQSKSLRMATKQGKESLPHTLGFHITERAHEVIARAITRERRIESDICRLLLDRGIAAYERDRQLFEPETDQAKYIRQPVTQTAPERKKTTGVQKKTGTGNR